jgi:hypothetical protein
MRIHPRLYLVGGHPLTDGTAVRAAGMWIGDAGAVSGVAAAWWHGLLPGPPPLIEVSVPHGTRRRPPDGIRIRRRDLDVRDLVGIRGIWVTAMPLTVLETAVRLDDGAAFLDRALQRQVSFEQLHAAFCRTVNAKGAPAMATAAGRGRRSRGLGGGAGADRAAARRGFHGVGPGDPLRPLRDRRRIP